MFGDLNDKNGQAIADKLRKYKADIQVISDQRGERYTLCDVTKWDDLVDIHELAIKMYGTIDAVVPNAGVNEVGDIFEDKYDESGRLLPPKTYPQRNQSERGI